MDKANNTLQIFLPLEMKDPMHAQVKVLKDRLVVLEDIDKSLAEIFKFNQELADFDKTLTSLQEWLDGKAKVTDIINARTIFLIFALVAGETGGNKEAPRSPFGP